MIIGTTPRRKPVGQPTWLSVFLWVLFRDRLKKQGVMPFLRPVRADGALLTPTDQPLACCVSSQVVEKGRLPGVKQEELRLGTHPRLNPDRICRGGAPPCRRWSPATPRASL